MTNELIDIYNEKNQFTGIQKLKSQAHRKGLWHRSTHVWIYRSSGEVLLQLRASKKILYPELWDISVSGHVNAGEQPKIAALREIKEEVGLTVDTKDLEFFKLIQARETYKNIQNNEHWYAYFLKLKKDVGTQKFKLQESEVEKVQFFSLKELETQLRKMPEKFVPHGNYWFEIIQEIRGKTKTAERN